MSVMPPQWSNRDFQGWLVAYTGLGNDINIAKCTFDAYPCTEDYCGRVYLGYKGRHVSTESVHSLIGYRLIMTVEEAGWVKNKSDDDAS